MKTTKELKWAVEEYQKGKQESFNIIYEQSYKYLHTCVIHVVKNEDAAMDMLQETYLEISRSILQLKDTENFLSWAAMIANRKCFAYLKKQRDVLVSIDEEGENSDYFESIADNEAFIPETVLQDREKVRLIKEIIDNLSDIQRLCVIGFYYNEQKQDEIARELGIPVNTVKSHLNRAKVKIKEAVIDLDTKKGTRLYSFVPFMLLFLDLEAQACETAAMSPALSQLCGNGNMMNVASGTNKAFGTASKADQAVKLDKAWKMASGSEKVIQAAALSMKAKVAIGAGIGLLSAMCVGSTIKGVYNVKEFIEQTKAEADVEMKTGEDKKALDELLELVKDVVSEETVAEEDREVSESHQEKSEETVAEEVIEEKSTKETEEEKDSDKIEDAESENTEEQEENFEALPISEEYRFYKKGNQGLIPVCNKEGKYGLVTYDNQIIIPFEYDSACEMVNEEGQSFFRNETGSYVFDRNGKQLFHTERRIQSVNEGIVLTMEGSDFDAEFAYYRLDGTLLLESKSEEDDKGAVPFNDGYAYLAESFSGRLSADGTVVGMEELVYGNQIVEQNQQENSSNGIIVDSASSPIGWVMEVPLSALNHGYYMSRGLLICMDDFGIYYLRSGDGKNCYSFDFSSIFNREGLSFSRSDTGWGVRNYNVNGTTFSNYGTIICPYIYHEGKYTYYLIDASKLVDNEVDFFDTVEEHWTQEEYNDYDYRLLTEEALLFVGDDVFMSNEKYWLVEKDGQLGYIDHAGNVMGMYEDATEFSNGKAIIIEDGRAYVIDESFTKIQELGKAISATNHGELFKVFMEEDFSTKMIKLS